MARNYKDKPTQEQKIVKYISDFGSITALEAFQDLGISQLAARIWGLKRKGYIFSKKRIYFKNRYGEITHYDKYFVEEWGEKI